MYVASVSTTIKFHDFPNGNVVHNYQPGKVEGPIRSISWSRDGNWLVVVPHSGQTEIVSTKDQLKLLKTIHEIDEPTVAAFQNTTKKNVGIGTKSGLVLVYDIKSRNVKKRFPRASTQITHVSFTAKDTHCVAACKNGDVLVFNNVTNSPPTNLRVPKSNSISCLKTNQLKRNLVLGGSNEGIVVVWDININRSKFCTEAHKAPVNSIAFSPVNSDLIITAGADRQFCFYDITDNKCIANMPVENSVTAVDFSPDGTYFVLASQNGRVYVYDSRNIQEPVHSFLAHKSAVRHIAFQNVQENDSSACSMSRSSENCAPLPSENIDKSKSIRTSDFFEMHLQNTDGISDTKSVVYVEDGDSFIAALGLDQHNSAASIDNDSVLVKNVSSRLSSVHVSELPCSTSPHINNAEIGELQPKPFSSTPKFQFNKSEQASPNILQKSVSNGVTSTDIKDLIKECVNVEFKRVVDDLKRDIEYQTIHNAHQSRAMILDIQMALVQGFINMENCINTMRDEMNPMSSYEKSLEEEIERLRKRIDLLEEQLKNVTVGKDINGE